MLTFRRRVDDERGVTLVLFALLMVALLGIAGLVVNIGLVRADRQRNKGAADVAVTAGMYALDAGGGQIATFRGACAALDYLKTNRLFHAIGRLHRQ
jgi:Flp pilus assembly protein TadG